MTRSEGDRIKEEEQIKAGHNFLTSNFFLFPWRSSQRPYEWYMKQREKKDSHAFQIPLIFP